MRGCLPAGRLGGRARVRPQPPASGPRAAHSARAAGGAQARRTETPCLIAPSLWLPLVTPRGGDGRRAGDTGVSGREGGSSNPRVRL